MWKPCGQPCFVTSVTLPSVVPQQSPQGPFCEENAEGLRDQWLGPRVPCSGAFHICRVGPCKVCSTPHISCFPGKKSLRGRVCLGVCPYTHTHLLSRGPRGSGVRTSLPSATCRNLYRSHPLETKDKAVLSPEQMKARLLALDGSVCQLGQSALSPSFLSAWK